MSEDEKYMKRCLQLAANGIQGARPNPMVGAVIVANRPSAISHQSLARAITSVVVRAMRRLMPLPVYDLRTNRC